MATDPFHNAEVGQTYAGAVRPLAEDAAQMVRHGGGALAVRQAALARSREITARVQGFIDLLPFVVPYYTYDRFESRRYEHLDSFRTSDEVRARQIQAAVVWPRTKGTVYEPSYPIGRREIGEDRYKRSVSEVLAVPAHYRDAKGDTIRPSIHVLRVVNEDWAARQILADRILGTNFTTQELDRIVDSEGNLTMDGRTPGSVILQYAWQKKPKPGRATPEYIAEHGLRCAALGTRYSDREYYWLANDLVTDGIWDSYDITKGLGELAAVFGLSDALPELPA